MLPFSTEDVRTQLFLATCAWSAITFANAVFLISDLALGRYGIAAISVLATLASALLARRAYQVRKTVTA